MTFDHSNKKISIIELIGKLLIGLLVAGFLAGIFAVLIARLPTNNNNNVILFQFFFSLKILV